MVSRCILTPLTLSITSVTKLCRMRDDCCVLLSASQKLRTGWPQTGLRWIATRLTSSGLVLSNSWVRLSSSPSIWREFTFLFQWKSPVWGSVRQSAHFHPMSAVSTLCRRSGWWGGVWPQTHLRLWYMLRLLVILTTTTACCTRSALMSPKLYTWLVGLIALHFYTDTQRWSSLVASDAEDCLQTLNHHLQVTTSVWSKVPSRASRVVVPVTTTCAQLLMMIYRLWQLLNILPLPLQDWTLTHGHGLAAW